MKSVRFRSGVPNNAVFVDDECFDCDLPISTNRHDLIVILSRWSLLDIIIQGNQEISTHKISMRFHLRTAVDEKRLVVNS